MSRTRSGHGPLGRPQCGMTRTAVSVRLIAGAPVAHVDHPVAERPGLDELELERRSERREEGQPAADDDGRMIAPYSSIRSSSAQAPASPGPPTAISPSYSDLRRATSSSTLPVASLVLPSTSVSVLEKTTFGSCRQMRANSAA